MHLLKAPRSPPGRRTASNHSAGFVGSFSGNVCTWTLDPTAGGSGIAGSAGGADAAAEAAAPGGSPTRYMSKFVAAGFAGLPLRAAYARSAGSSRHVADGGGAAACVKIKL